MSLLDVSTTKSFLALAPSNMSAGHPLTSGRHASLHHKTLSQLTCGALLSERAVQARRKAEQGSQNYSKLGQGRAQKGSAEKGQTGAQNGRERQGRWQ